MEDVKLHKIVDKALYNDRVETKVGEEEPVEDIREELEKCLKKPVKFSFKVVLSTKKALFASTALLKLNILFHW